MKLALNLLIFLLFASDLIGQELINGSIVRFDSECCSVEDDLIEEKFRLLELTSQNGKSRLSFAVITNCSNMNQGNLYLNGDTLIVKDTDLEYQGTKVVETRTDSVTGLVYEISEETYLSSISFCDCQMKFTYDFSIEIDQVNQLKFHEGTFPLEIEGRK